LLKGRDAAGFLQAVRRDLLAERLPAETLDQLIGLTLCSVYRDSRLAAVDLREEQIRHVTTASVC
jgi:hypothetical protein